MASAAPMLDRVRQPEYTGENRCVPCTAANVAIAAVVAVVVGYFWWPAGVAVFLVSLAAIWLRGYLVPRTPELTKRYFPDRVLAAFDKEPAPATGMAGTAAVTETAGADRSDVDTTESEAARASTAEERPVDPETVLLEAGVVEPCVDEDDLCLDDEFRTAWYERMQTLGEDDAMREALAGELDLDPDGLEFEDQGVAFVATYDGARAGRWESRAALVADLAASNELPAWVERWDDLPVGARSQLLGGLRIFLDVCPGCGGPVEAGMNTVESCCRSREVVAASCGDCDARLLEVPYEGEVAG